MEKQFVATSDHPHVVVEAHGELVLKGTDEPRVVAKTDSASDLTLEPRGDDIYVRCTADCIVRVPRQASVTVQAVHGEAAIKALEGALAVGEAHGDLNLRNVGPARLDTVRGNLSAKHVAGELAIGSIHGNMVARDVQGPFTVSGSISGNLSLDDVESGSTARVSGNVTLRLDPAPGQSYDFSADGNLFCRLPDDASAELSIPRAGKIVVNLPDVRTTQAGEAPYHLTLGEGDARLTLSAGGNVLLTSQAPDWEMSEDFDADFGAEFSGMAEDLAASVARQMEMHMDTLSRQLESQMANLSVSLGAAGLSPEQAERISQRAREAAERGAARAQERLRAVQERMKHKIEAAQRRAERHARHTERHARRWRPSTHQPEPSGEPVSDEERLLILKMLEEKKISLEEADKLLSALEGKE